MTYPRPSSFGPAADAAASGTASVVPSPRFPDIERDTLAFWDADGTFRASIENRDGAEEWVFYDGPPFANGLPHYGHLLTGYAKDVFPRFQTMRGKKVDRVFGWDTHGLPAELEAMKQLGITEKDEIERMGVAVFNGKARESVLEYTRDWQDYVTRQARWVDFERGYKTLDTSYMESVLWAFKTLHDKGLAYEGYRVLPYCWRDETPLSSHELRMDDDVYKMRQDPSVTVTFPLVGAKAEALGLTGVRALAWTTTPWTLPTNLALAVGPGIRYAVVEGGPNGAADVHRAPDGTPDEAFEAVAHRYLLAEDLLPGYAKDLGYESVDAARAAVQTTILGAELEGVSYDRLFDYYAVQREVQLGVGAGDAAHGQQLAADGEGLRLEREPLPGERYGGVHLLGPREDRAPGFVGLCRRDDGRALLDDSGLDGGDLGDRVPQAVGVVDVDRREHRDVAVGGVRRVPLAAHPDLEHQDVDRRVRAGDEREHGQQFEERQGRVSGGGQLGIHQLDEGLDLVPRVGDRGIRHRLAVDEDALGEALEMRAREEARAEAERAQQTLDDAGRRGLTVGAGHVDDAVRALGVVEQLEHATRALDARLHPLLALAFEERGVDGVGARTVAHARAPIRATATVTAPTFA